MTAVPAINGSAWRSYARYVTEEVNETKTSEPPKPEEEAAFFSCEAAIKKNNPLCLLKDGTYLAPNRCEIRVYPFLDPAAGRDRQVMLNDPDFSRCLIKEQRPGAKKETVAISALAEGMIQDLELDAKKLEPEVAKVKEKLGAIKDKVDRKKLVKALDESFLGLLTKVDGFKKSLPAANALKLGLAFPDTAQNKLLFRSALLGQAELLDYRIEELSGRHNAVETEIKSLEEKKEKMAMDTDKRFDLPVAKLQTRIEGKKQEQSELKADLARVKGLKENIIVSQFAEAAISMRFTIQEFRENLGKEQK